MSHISPTVKQSGSLANPSLTITHSCNKCRCAVIYFYVWRWGMRCWSLPGFLRWHMSVAYLKVWLRYCGHIAYRSEVASFGFVSMQLHASTMRYITS